MCNSKELDSSNSWTLWNRTNKIWTNVLRWAVPFTLVRCLSGVWLIALKRCAVCNFCWKGKLCLSRAEIAYFYTYFRSLQRRFLSHAAFYFISNNITTMSDIKTTWTAQIFETLLAGKTVNLLRPGACSRAWKSRLSSCCWGRCWHLYRGMLVVTVGQVRWAFLAILNAILSL